MPEHFCQVIPEEDIFSILEKRQGQLDAVVMCGGEPTIQEDLIPFLAKIKSLGFLVKLDTNGSRPDVISEIVEKGLVDYFAMDVKAPFEKYVLLSGVNVDLSAIKKSIKLIMRSDVDHEFRTTFAQQFLNKTDLQIIRSFLVDAKLYRIQDYISPDEKPAMGKVVFKSNQVYKKETL